MSLSVSPQSCKLVPLHGLSHIFGNTVTRRIAESKKILRIGVPQLTCSLIPVNSLFHIQRNTLTQIILEPKFKLRTGFSLFCRLLIPLYCFCQVSRDTSRPDHKTNQVETAKGHIPSLLTFAMTSNTFCHHADAFLTSSAVSSFRIYSNQNLNCARAAPCSAAF